MSHEIKNSVAVELSETELDSVAGGFGGIFIGDRQNLTLDTGSTFKQSDLAVNQQTFAGPGGAGTNTVVLSRDISSYAGQFLNIGK